MITYCCKTCGRAIKAEEKPTFCYFDRTINYENISDEDAIKMGLFSTTKGTYLIDHEKNQSFTIEFDKDLIYNPFTGEKAKEVINPEHSLRDFQKHIMRKVIANQ